MIGLPPGVAAMAARGPRWADWVRTLVAEAEQLIGLWGLEAEGEPTHGYCSVVIPVRTGTDEAAMLKIGFPDQESEHEHLALRRWAGHGAVRLLRADPHRRALLLERLLAGDLGSAPEDRACAVVADLYRRLHVPAMPALRPLSFFVEQWTADLAALPRTAPVPRRLLEQAVALGGDLLADRSVPHRVLHTDLHYGNVLAATREPWLAIDPKPVNGDPHYELAPMLWNRWDDIADDVRAGVRRRFWTLVEAAGFDEDRARAWVTVRMVHNAMWSAMSDLQDGPTERLTRCIAVAKAVQR